MTTKLTAALLAATALGALAAAPATAAHHVVKKKRTTVTSSGPSVAAQLAEQQRQIEALRAQLSAMQSAPPAAAPAPTIDEEAAANAEFLKAQVDALQAQLDAVKVQTAANAPTFGATAAFKGSGGFSFKPTGEIQYDAGYVSNPGDRVATANLGFNNRARRLLLGAQGDLPGGWKYSFQFNFAQAVIDYEDVVLSYEPAGKPYSVTIGYFYPYNGLENLTSNRFLSFFERDQMVDAFAEGRRLGVGLGYVSGDLRLSAGVFGNAIGNANYDNNDYEVAGRVLYAPQGLGGQLHFAVNAQYRHFKPSSFGQQYRARPFTQTTDQRFIDSGTLAAKSDTIYGVEAMGIFGPFHVAGEAQVLKLNGIRPGELLSPGQVPAGTLLASDPTFWSAYGEAGYWLTGETRGYRNGKVDRTKILNGFDKGGWGGFQIAGRVSYTNLRDTVGGTGTGVVNGVLNGGRQLGYLASLNWWPIDYVRFSLQYTHAEIEGGPRAATVLPFDIRPVYDRRYSVDVGLVRAQVDF